MPLILWQEEWLRGAYTVVLDVTLPFVLTPSTFH